MLVVIEWVDGSGKATQTEKVTWLLRGDGHHVGTLSFPAYGEKSAYFVEEFLNGSYWPVDEIDPYLWATFYSLDRLGQKKTIEKKIEINDFVISDRYSTATFVHRGSQYLYDGEEEKLRPFFDWVYDLEFNKIKLPKPDLIIFLSLGIDNIKMLLQKKAKETRLYVDGDAWLDWAETNLQHQVSSLKVWKEILPWYFENYEVVNCEADDWTLLSRDEIAQKIYTLIQEYSWKLSS